MSSKEKTILAAIEIFSQKGKHGARMEEIAKEAGVNKSMVYYYHSSKENLYREVLKKIFYKIFLYSFSELERIQSEEMIYTERIEVIIRVFSKIYSENPNYTRIIINALANEPEDVKYIIRFLKAENDFIRPEKLLDLIEQATSSKALRKIDAKQTMISIIGVSMIYFIGKPIMEIMLGLDLEDEDVFLKERQDSLVDLVLNGIVNRPE
ncbi:MAG: TetR family transcriptional regulator [Candidatus Electryonea clarkiae]|nr:TetR family transcriptional regulator [Candidatus Electryonea clarkiae]MDP8288559.1 TetR family transcriptional regulator [Candidatus Electryonea clarkiae]